MAFWLLKSEPSAYSWAQLVRDGRGRWDGVRSHAAAAHLRAMRRGDLAAFYHSETGKEVVGIMKVVRIAYADPTAKSEQEKKGNWVAVDVAPVKALARTVTLAEIKRDAVLHHMPMVRQGRLSVSSMTAVQWKRLLALGAKQKTAR